ncbi:FAD/NAD(P)-binding protein [Lentilactobacillus sp. SPB1-3]|uniref:FAD/NAD(P)-binding protein n=1 Tax=Lentilactobacillus terminaliae TaxID=3003483 RepID=A0ACD5DFY7_9LACO|nr:FAD/NAD(P)-binding protein [Lentilactobacillus sp. SPB1-3]MCZ0976576.1 FAD/NAD(P)-binding protein [Lentilactobacillus sp. SPB1-3]
MKIAIIGAGPRGVLVTSALLNQYKQRTDQTEPLEIKIFDPYGIGGRVWRTDQWNGLVMNSPADQVSLFTDETVNLSSKVYDGPALFGWLKSDVAKKFLTEHNFDQEMIDAASNIAPNDYAPRTLYGAYIQWFYSELLRQLAHNVSLEVIKSQIISLNTTQDAKVNVVTSDKEEIFDKIVMALGQQDNYLNTDEQELASYAEENELKYFQPTHPGDVNVDDLPAGEPVIIRGLSLSFLDYTSELTLGRGGQYFKNDDGTLFYQPSGREPKIIAGSVHGVPYYPKPVSEKRYGEMVQPVFLTQENVDKHLENGKLPFETFIDLIRSDFQLHYYMLLINDSYPFKSATQFKEEFIAADDKQAVIDSYDFPEEDQFDWDYILDPFKDIKVISTTDYQNVVVNWLNGIVKDAKKGSKTGPLTSTLELFRDFAPTLRKLVAENIFSSDEYANDFRGTFIRNRNFLAVGGPAFRSAQLSALIRAGIVTIMAPGMEVKAADGWFVTASPKRNNDIFKSSVLIEARVPKADIKITANPLLEDLKSNGMLREYSVMVRDEAAGLAAIDVNPNSDQLLAANGSQEADIFLWGVPLDGLRLATTASPRPGTNDPNLQTADKIAAMVLGLKPADDVLMM